MKRIILFIIFSISVFSAFATKVTVTNSGFTFSPSSITINLGDTVLFTISSNHNVVEVSKETWDANGNTSNGGFNLPFGGGELVLSSAGTFYYVCSPHAAMGMKGVIIVNAVTSVGKSELAGDFKVFPSPADDYVVLTSKLANSSHLTVELIDMTGRKIMDLLSAELPSGDFEKQVNINRSAVKAGRYFIKATYDGHSYTQSIILK